MAQPPVVFASADALRNLPPPPAPTGTPTLLTRARQVGSVARFSARPGVFPISVRDELRRQHSLVRACSKKFGHKGGQARILDDMAPGQDLHARLRDASPQERRRAGVTQGTPAWVLNDDDPLRLHFSDLVFMKKGNHFGIVYGRCYVKGELLRYTTDKKYLLEAHHDHAYRSDILIAALHNMANKLVSGLNVTDGTYNNLAYFSLFGRVNRVYSMCLEMDAIRARTLNLPSISASGKRKGSTALQAALSVGGLLHDELLEPVSRELRNEAGLKPRDRAFMFKESALQRLRFVSRSTVFLYTVENVPGEGNKSYFKVVHGQCSITGVGGRKTNDQNWPVVLHHITANGRHYLVGFIHNDINRGLGALGDYKSK